MARHLDLLPDARPGNTERQGARSTSGQDEALEDRIFALVYRQTRALAGPSSDLDDLVQTAAEQALRALGTFERRADLATWTYRICYFTLLKQRRWYRRWCKRFVLSRDPHLLEVADRQISAVDSLQRRERYRRLRRALERLSPKRRTVVILHDLQGMSIERIGEIVSAKPNTVRSRLRDGRKRLLEELRQDPYFGDEACAISEQT